MRVGGPPQGSGLALPRSRRGGAGDPLVRPDGPPLPRQVAEGAGGAGPEVRGQELPAQFRLHFRLRRDSCEKFKGRRRLILLYYH